jgi:hypothetical protein
MATDPSQPARPRAERAPDAPTLAADVHHHCRAVIESELRRLARRAPCLHENELDVVDTVLDDLVESLFLARLRNTPQHTAQVAQLFGLTTDSQPPHV